MMTGYKVVLEKEVHAAAIVEAKNSIEAVEKVNNSDCEFVEDKFMLPDSDWEIVEVKKI